MSHWNTKEWQSCQVSREQVIVNRNYIVMPITCYLYFKGVRKPFIAFLFIKAFILLALSVIFPRGSSVPYLQIYRYSWFLTAWGRNDYIFSTSELKHYALS